MATPAKVKKSIVDFESLNTYLKLQIQSATLDEKKILIAEQQAERQRVINQLRANYNVLSQKDKDLLDTYVEDQRKLLELEKQHNKQLEAGVKYREKQLAVGKFLVDVTKQGWKILMESDKVIKSTNLSLGLSGAKASAMRSSFEQSIRAVSMLGGNMQDIGNIQQGYADETGRAQVITGKMVEDIAAIGKGTGLGIEQATQLAAQFDYMGISAEKTMSNVQGIVDTSERMGINTTKVLKNLNDNFKKLNTFTFTRGSKAMGEMAMNAEKTRVSMTTALNVAEASRSLETVISLGANLQVMGGEFGKMDPFEWLYMVRNEPDKLNDKISEMTRGLYTLKKNSEGTFETFISPADVDRMRNVAKQLNISNEEMAQIGQRRLVLDKLGGTLKGLGFTQEQKEWVAGAAKLNEKSGQFEVMVGENMVDIRELTKTQGESFVQQHKLLADRAKEAQTFDEVLKNTINALKGGLLPLLSGVNKILEKIRPIFEAISKFGTGGAILTLVAGAAAIKLATFYLSTASANFVKTGSMFRATGAAGRLTNFTGAVTPNNGGGSNKRLRTGGAKAGANAGKGMMRGGAGIGAAALGIGAGIGLAALGISKLAEAMAKLDATQVAALPNVLYAMAAAIAAFTVPLIFLAPVLSVASGGLLAFGGAALMIGGGIGIAAAGIGLMSLGLGELAKNIKGTGVDFMEMGLGIAAVGASLAMLSNPITLIGVGAFGLVMAGIVGASLAAAHVANSMAKMGVALKGSAPDFIAIQNAIESISKANVSGGGMLADLANLLKSPLKVEFADKTVNLRNDITLNMDGSKIFNRIYDTNVAIKKQADAKAGLAANK